MSKRLLAAALTATVVALVAVGSTPQGAAAHERRTVQGTYTFVVGFLDEPALVEEPNAISLTVSNVQTNAPVEGIEKTLKVDATTGGQIKTFDLRARFGQPGAYIADLIPTKTGTWVFRFHGTIESAAIDERFESGPGRFNDVESKAALEFPPSAQVPADGSPASAGGETVASAAAEAQRALDKAESARTTGIAVGAAGLLAGLVGIALGVLALSSRRPHAGDGGSGSRGAREPV